MSVLDPEVHGRLIEEIDTVADYAGIPKRYIEQGMLDVCEPEEVDYVRCYPKNAENGIFGMCYVGVSHLERMMYVTGCFTRNFILAQVIPLTTVLEMLKEGRPPDPSVLLIPSFHRHVGKNAALTAYQVSNLWGLLEDRMIRQKQTVVGIDSMSKMKSDYGSYFEDLFRNHYVKVTT